MHLIGEITITLGTVAQGGLRNIIFYLLLKEGNYRNAKKVFKNIFGHLVKRLKNRKGKRNSSLCLGLGGRSTIIHFFLVLNNVYIYVLVSVLQRNRPLGSIYLSINQSGNQSRDLL